MDAQREGFVKPVEPASTQQPAIASNGASGEPVSAPEPELETLKETWPIRVKLLHKPVKNNQGEFVHELVFREPTGGDVSRLGNPCRITFDGEIVMDEPKMMRIIAALSGILPPFLEAMDPRDWNSCAYRIRSFFLPEAGAW
jgi:hypothetical protein